MSDPATPARLRAMAMRLLEAERSDRAMVLNLIDRLHMLDAQCRERLAEQLHEMAAGAPGMDSARDLAWLVESLEEIVVIDEPPYWLDFT